MPNPDGKQGYDVEHLNALAGVISGDLIRHDPKPLTTDEVCVESDRDPQVPDEREEVVVALWLLVAYGPGDVTGWRSVASNPVRDEGRGDLILSDKPAVMGQIFCPDIMQPSVALFSDNISAYSLNRRNDAQTTLAYAAAARTRWKQGGVRDSWDPEDDTPALAEVGVGCSRPE